MYHVVMKDGTITSYAHPTVSTVTGETRTIWQLVDDEETAVATYATADIAATIDCVHEEEDCVCVETVEQQLAPPTETGAEIAARKLKAAREARAAAEPVQSAEAPLAAYAREED